ncbi:MAG: hypothetical protein A7316_05530 [Candidatus Altiarchaeales archaeon WOR_SM1_86-2]|nr:MAG: hypothetical protein A7316_05530 [Candidatus Altiarchaeales archaeon WOR_SM1_86-2]
MRIIIIGCGDAGISAAFSALRENPKAEILVIEKKGYFYPKCPLPFVLEGDVKIEDIVTPLSKLFANSGINYETDEVVGVDTENKVVQTKNNRFTYDCLIIATGSKAVIPPIKGVNLEGVYTLKTLEDTKKIMQRMEKSKEAVIIGGGFIGCETAASLTNKNISTTIVELLPNLLSPQFDANFSRIVENKLNENGVRMITGKSVDEIIGKDEVEAVRVGDEIIACSLVIMSVGVRPDVEFLKTIEVGKFGIKVDEKLRTSAKGVYACGDCIRIRFMVTNEPQQSGLGTVAERAGHVAGLNAAGGDATFYHTLNSMITKIFDLEIGVTGMNETMAKERGYKVVSGIAKGLSKPKYYPGGKELITKLIYHANIHKLLGAEIAGYEGVDGYLNLASMAIQKGSIMDDMLRFRYCYAPPICSAPNPMIPATENAYRKLRRRR